MIYLDHAATSPCDWSMLTQLGTIGNASSIHDIGVKAKTILENSRSSLKSRIGATEGNLIFTSGGTEANNLALLGIEKYLRLKNKTHIITSPIEHPSVLECIKSLFDKGFEVTYLDVKNTGVISIEELESCIKPNTGLVSLMTVNNEIGTINPIEEIGQVCKKHDVLFHTDAVQGFGSLDIDVNDFNIDLMSVSGHKLGAPHGIGFLYVRKPETLSPILLGGGQECGLRSGTESAALAHCFTRMATKVFNNAPDYDYFAKLLKEQLKNKLGVDRVTFVSSTLLGECSSRIHSITIKNIDAQTLILLLSKRGVCVSAGSACHSSNNEPSYVLKHIGLSDSDALSTIRVSFGVENNVSDIVRFSDILAECVQILDNLPKGELK